MLGKLDAAPGDRTEEEPVLFLGSVDLQRYETARADINYYLPYFATDTLQRIPGMRVQQQTNYVYDIFMDFKVNKPMVTDGALREAINMSINKMPTPSAVSILER